MRGVRVKEFLVLVVVGCVLNGKQATSFDLHDPFGQVVRSERRFGTGSIIDYIELYAQEAHDRDGELMRDAILTRYPTAQANILVCHGFMCDQHDARVLAQIFGRGKYNCMTFNFRAHDPFDAPKNQLCTFGQDEVLDVLSAARFLQSYKHTKGLPTIAFGFSMGAAILIEAQAKYALFNAMILDCPFDSAETVVANAIDAIKIPFFGMQFALPGKKILQSYAFHPYVQSFIKLLLKTVPHYDTREINFTVCEVNPYQSIKKVRIPCFFITCKNDEKIPVDAVRRIFDNAEGWKMFWETNGRWHFDSYFYNPERYSNHVCSFVYDVLHDQLSPQQCNTVMVDPDDHIYMKKIVASEEVGG